MQKLLTSSLFFFPACHTGTLTYTHLYSLVHLREKNYFRYETGQLFTLPDMHVQLSDR